MTNWTQSNHDQDHNHFTVRDVVASYNAGAPTLAPEYEGLPFEKIHAPVLDLLPDTGACVLDMGAGTGRDSAWFAANGYKVVAAEPAAGMRDAGKALHRSPDIHWLDDALPALEKVLRSPRHRPQESVRRRSPKRAARGGLQPGRKRHARGCFRGADGPADGLEARPAARGVATISSLNEMPAYSSRGRQRDCGSG